MDVDVVRKHGQGVSRVVSYFSIPLETYTISELLMLFQTALPAMTWSRDEHEYHVKVVLDKTVDDSLDYLVPDDITATKSGIAWMEWLDAEIPQSGMVCNRDGLSMGSGPIGPENQEVMLTVKKGMTYRQILDEISEADRTNWEADVEDEELYGRDYEASLHQNFHVPHEHIRLRLIGTRDSDYDRRAAVTFHAFYRKNTSPGTTIAPVMSGTTQGKTTP